MMKRRTGIDNEEGHHTPAGRLKSLLESALLQWKWLWQNDDCDDYDYNLGVVPQEEAVLLKPVLKVSDSAYHLLND